MKKIIHYCWFGGKPLPKLAKKCIASWKKYMPDYEIKEWNESNFDVNSCVYAKEAYQAKKFAFVSDYARYVILYEHGGLYFDTDVEIIKPLNEIISKGNFLGCETSVPNITVAPGLGMGAEAGLPFYKEIIQNYESSRFLNEDGTVNLLNVVTRTTETLKKYDLQEKEEIQFVAGINIYPKEYFNPCDLQTGRIKIGKLTHAIHHYAASWVNTKDKIRSKSYQILSRIFGKKFAEKIKKIIKKNV